MIVEIKRTNTGVRATYKNKTSKVCKFEDWHSPVDRAIRAVVGGMFNFTGIDFNSTFSENEETEVSQFYTTSTGLILFRIEAKRDIEGK